MATGPVASTPRAGANIAVDLTTDPAGIVSINPAHLVLSTANSTADVQVKALTAGSTLLRMSVPPAYSASGTPLAVTVVP